MIDAKLVLVGERQKPTVIKLKKLPMTVGRGKEADLTLAHPMVSRLHCELYEVDGTLCIRDMGSLNGTYVGDIRITEASLESGDMLTIGEATFKVVVGKSDSEQSIMPPTVEDAAADEAIDFTTADDSFIDMSDEDDAEEETPDEPKPKKAPAAQEQAPDKTAEKEPAAETKGDKTSGKRKGEAATIAFEPPDKESDPADAGDDDDLQDFLSSLS